MSEQLALLVPRLRPSGRAWLLAALLALALVLALTARLAILAGAGSATPAASTVSASLPASAGAARTSLASLPRTAQGPVSRAIGAAEPAYRVTSSAAGLGARSADQRLQARFTRAGVSVASGPLRLGMRLEGIGAGAELRPLGEVSPRASANTVLYARPGLSEWYANGPLGLEQGFTLARAPSRGGQGALTLAFALSTNAHLALAGDGQSLTVASGAGQALRYGELLATDARGRIVHSRLELHGGEMLLRVDARGASYPIRIDPLIQQGEAVTGASEGEGEGGYFGRSVAISADGGTALIGAPRDGDFAGAAWVFTRSGSTWTQQGPMLSGGEEEGKGYFGQSVALSADGDTALVGGFADAIGEGAAWVFTRSGSTWTQQGRKLTGAGESGKGYFGQSVALSADGQTALIGAPRDGGEAGAAWVFALSGGSWRQQGAKLSDGAEGAGSELGESVALSEDGDTALVGAPGEHGNVGAAWLFARRAGAWTQPALELTGASEELGAGYFGKSVALSADASTALVGAYRDNGRTGAVWAFARAGEAWSQQGPKLTGADAHGEPFFGDSVAVSSDGDTALIGGPRDDSKVGAVWTFVREGGRWEQAGSKLMGIQGAGRPAVEPSEEEEEGNFGRSIALSSEGTLALIGSPRDAGDTGAVREFVEAPVGAPTIAKLAPDKGPAGGGTTVKITGANFDKVSAVAFGSQPARSFTVDSESTIEAVSPAEPAGLVDVTVTSAQGSSEGSAASVFRFQEESTGTGSKSSGASGAGGTGTVGSGSGGVLAFGATAVAAIQPCRVLLAARRVAVVRERAVLKLLDTGTGRCGGRLRLTVRYRSGTGRLITRTIGTATFALADGTSLLRVKLNALGRARLADADGRLAATLSISQSSPASTRAQTAVVHLARQRRPASTKAKG